MQKALPLGIILSVLMAGIVSPAYAKFDKLEDKQARREKDSARVSRQADDIAAMRDAQQQLNILLKGLLIEVRKQTVLLNSQTTEQQNIATEMHEQTQLLETLVKEIQKANTKKKKKTSK